jgi:peptidylprolyl isomerase
MSSVKNGDTVKVHYVGKFKDGAVFDSSRNREPLELKIGSGKIIPGFEKGVLGMEVGETKELSIAPDEGFGEKRSDLKIPVKKSDFPNDIEPSVGQQLQFRQPNGTPINVTVTDISGEDVTLDANHPLAGKTLSFEIELLEIV